MKKLDLRVIISFGGILAIAIGFIFTKGTHRSQPNIKESNLASTKPAASNDEKNKLPVNLSTLKDQETRSLYGQIQSLLNCRQEDCNFSTRDPRSYDIELNRRILRELRSLAQMLPFGSEIDGDLESLILELSIEESPFIQEGLLAIISRLKARPELQEIISQNFLHSVSPQIVQQSLVELLKYKELEEGKLISTEIARLLRNGSPIGAKRALKELHHFLDDENYSTFRKLHVELPKGPIKDHLKMVLDDYLERA